MADAAELGRALAARGVPALATVEWTEAISSTSDRLKAPARTGAAEWTAVLADRQTGGRGREGRAWASPIGGPTCRSCCARAARSAASLAGATPIRPAIPEVAAAVLGHLRVCYDGLRADLSRIVEAWRARAVAWWGELVDVETGRETLRGRMRGVDAEGALLLLVDLEDGNGRRILSGEVHRLRRASRE